MAMDLSSAYLFRGMGEGQMKKILAVGKVTPTLWWSCPE
jgi:hypothetical protein